MIQAEHITKAFHGFKALDDMSLHVPKGTIYGLVGPNGAGKSTLIRHLTGIYRPDCGSILIDGLPVYDNPEAKAKFTYIPDDLFYFLQAAQIDDKVTITPSIIVETRRRAHLDLMVTHGNHTVCKSVVVVKKT